MAKVLLVDDEEEILSILRQFVEGMGYETLLARTAQIREFTGRAKDKNPVRAAIDDIVNGTFQTRLIQRFI